MGMNEAICRVFDVQRFSIHDGPGIRTTVFLQGCPLRCGWCQNPEAFDVALAHEMTPAAVLAEVMKDQAFYAVSGGGLTVSGGEPLLHVAPIRALLEAAKQQRLHTCVQTSGAVPQTHFAAVLDWVDVFQFDLKHMDAQRHRQLTGVDTARIHANAAFLLEQGAAVQFRMPLIPGVNDDAGNLAQVAGFLRAHGVVELRIVPYHRMYLEKYRALGQTSDQPDLQPPSEETLARVSQQLAQHGLLVTVDA